MNVAIGILHALLGMILAPLLPGIINRMKALAAGRKGPPLLQLYYDLSKLLRKGTVYSRTTTGLIVAGPIVGLSAAIMALWITPLAGKPGVLSFPGDVVLLASLLGLMRFATVLAALDTGSSFEGMGASREVFFSALAEPALLLGVAALAIQAQSLSLGMIYAAIPLGLMPILAAAALLIVFLAENSRLPVDDPNTHLELTMIHEAMILDHGGPDLAMIQYGAALKLWVLGALLVGILVPAHLAAALCGMAALAVVTGIIESSMARLKLARVPTFLMMASLLSILALLWAVK